MGLWLVERMGIDAIHGQIERLDRSIMDDALERGFRLATPATPYGHGALIALRSNSAQQLVAQMTKEGIVVSKRDDNIRISPHAYNNQSDVELLMLSLARHSH